MTCITVRLLKAHIQKWRDLPEQLFCDACKTMHTIKHLETKQILEEALFEHRRKYHTRINAPSEYYWREKRCAMWDVPVDDYTYQ